jgi:hypothetical protein
MSCFASLAAVIEEMVLDLRLSRVNGLIVGGKCRTDAGPRPASAPPKDSPGQLTVRDKGKGIGQAHVDTRRTHVGIGNGESIIRRL